MLERSVVVPRRRALFASLLVITPAAVVAPAAMLFPREPVKRVLVAPPVVPCDSIESLGVCVAPHADGALIVRMSKYSAAARLVKL
jgi:hypothetical protein